MLKRGYAPLEQYYNKKENQGPWTDIYSIAATLYRAITGVKPPEALERMDVDELKSPGEMGISVPSHIESAIMSRLNLKYTHRPKTLDDFIRQLEPKIPTEIISKEKTLPEMKAKYRNIKVKALVLMGLAIVMLAVSITFALIEKGKEQHCTEQREGQDHLGR
jgi:serine/threonine protein kinase